MSSWPADDPDDPLLLGSQEFRRTESSESVENLRQAADSLRPVPEESRRNTTPGAEGATVGGDSESLRPVGGLVESRRNEDDAPESRRNEDGKDDG